MTRMLHPSPPQNRWKRVLFVSLAATTLIAAGCVAALIGSSNQTQEQRAEWLERAQRGYQNVKLICADRQIFGIQEEIPPIIYFYLNEQGAFDDTFAHWRVESDGKRIIYRLEVQFRDFDVETMTRIAKLDEAVDDGDLMKGHFTLSMSGFTCRLPGPELSSVQIEGELVAYLPIESI